VKRLAFIISVMGFFVLAFVGWSCGLSTYACGLKALGGAAMLYVVARLAGRLAAGVVADTIVNNMTNGRGANNRDDDNRN